MSAPPEARSRVRTLRAELERHNRLYYVDDNPEISDAEYDRLFHECDHLDGVLYPMRIRDFTKFGFNDALFPGQDLPAEE